MPTHYVELRQPPAAEASVTKAALTVKPQKLFVISASVKFVPIAVGHSQYKTDGPRILHAPLRDTGDS